MCSGADCLSVFRGLSQGERAGDLQLDGPGGVLQQADGLRVAHAFGRGPADADDAVADLEK